MLANTVQSISKRKNDGCESNLFTQKQDMSKYLCVYVRRSPIMLLLPLLLLLLLLVLLLFSLLSARLRLFFQTLCRWNKRRHSFIYRYIMYLYIWIDTLFRKKLCMLNFPWPSQFFGWSIFMGHKIEYVLLVISAAFVVVVIGFSYVFASSMFVMYVVRCGQTLVFPIIMWLKIKMSEHGRLQSPIPFGTLGLISSL